MELTHLGQREEAGAWIAWFRAEGHWGREFAGGGAGALDAAGRGVQQLPRTPGKGVELQGCCGLAKAEVCGSR